MKKKKQGKPNKPLTARIVKPIEDVEKRVKELEYYLNNCVIPKI